MKIFQILLSCSGTSFQIYSHKSFKAECFKFIFNNSRIFQDNLQQRQDILSSAAFSIYIIIIFLTFKHVEPVLTHERCFIVCFNGMGAQKVFRKPELRCTPMYLSTHVIFNASMLFSQNSKETNVRIF